MKQNIILMAITIILATLFLTSPYAFPDPSAEDAASAEEIEATTTPIATAVPSADPFAVDGVYSDGDISFDYPADWVIEGDDIYAGLTCYPTEDVLYTFTIEKGDDTAIGTHDITSWLDVACLNSDASSIGVVARVTLYEPVGGYDAAVSETYWFYTQEERLRRMTYQLVVDGSSYTITLNMRESGDGSPFETPALEETLYSILDSITFATPALRLEDAPITEMQADYAVTAGLVYYPANWDVSITQYEDYQTKTFYDENASLTVRAILSAYGVDDITNVATLDRTHGAVVTLEQVSEITVADKVGTQANYTYTAVDGTAYQGQWVVVEVVQNGVAFDYSYCYTYRTDAAAEYATLLDEMLAQLEW